jgi:phage portal protein BeeE
VRLADRLVSRWSNRYWEGEASGAAVVMAYGPDPKREPAAAGMVMQAQQAHQTNGVVFACVLARMMLLSEATFKFRTKTDKSLYGNESLRILEYPWPNGTAGDLWARMEQDVSTAGNSFIWQAETDLLVRLPPGEVIIVSEEVVGSSGNTYRNVLGYDWDPSRSNPPGMSKRPQAQFFPVDEVAHWAPYPDPLARFRGMSWLTPVLREVRADTGMTDYKTQYLDHGTPVTAVKYPVKLRQDTIDAVSERVMAKYGGVGNAFKPLVFDQGGDPTVGAGLRDLDYASVQAAGEQRIATAAGVPLAVLGLKQPSDNSSYQVEMRRFADLTIRPLWRSGCAALQKLVPNFPPRGVELWFDTSDIAALQAAETERAQVTQVNAAAALTLIQAGFTRESVVSAVTSGDLGLLKADPNAPTPGFSARETVTEAVPAGDDTSVLGKTGIPPGGPQAILTKPQTPASKTPMPASFPTKPAPANGARPATPSPNK